MATNGSDRDDTGQTGDAGGPRHAVWQQRISEARARRTEILQSRLEEVRQKSGGQTVERHSPHDATPRQPERSAPAMTRAARDRPLTLAAAQSGRIQPQVSPATLAPSHPAPLSGQTGSRLATGVGLGLVLAVAIGVCALYLMRETDVTLVGLPGGVAMDPSGSMRPGDAPAGTIGGSEGEMPAWPERASLGSTAPTDADPVAPKSTDAGDTAEWAPPGGDAPPPIIARSVTPTRPASPGAPATAPVAPRVAPGPADPPLSPSAQTAPNGDGPPDGPAPQTAPAPPQRP